MAFHWLTVKHSVLILVSLLGHTVFQKTLILCLGKEKGKRSGKEQHQNKPHGDLIEGQMVGDMRR